MSRWIGLDGLIPRWMRAFPPDLAIVVLAVGIAWIPAVAPGGGHSLVRLVLGVPIVTFLPGYAFVSVVYPDRQRADHERDDPETIGRDGILSGRPIDAVERVALSFACSVTIVPLIGLLLDGTPFGVALRPYLAAVSVLTLALVGLGAIRRWSLPAEARFTVHVRERFEGVRSAREMDSRRELLVSAAFAVSILLAASSVAYALAGPSNDTAYTELYLLSESRTGDLVASDVPEAFEQGASRDVYVGVENHERRVVSYSIVVELQRVRETDDSTTFVDEREVDRFHVRLADGETKQLRHEFVPTVSSGRYRLVYLLYAGPVPDQPDRSNAYRSVSLQTNVTETV